MAYTKEKAKAYYKAYREANLEKCRERGRAYREANREKIKAYKKAWHKANKDKIKAYREANKEKIKEYDKAYREANKDKIKANCEANKEEKKAYDKAYYEANKEEHRVRSRAYYQANKAKYFQRVYKREKKMKEFQTPAWANIDKMNETYKECKRISEETGILHHVDHIIPLNGRNVSGLHVETNLQIITAHENLSKHNSFAGDSI